MAKRVTPNQRMIRAARYWMRKKPDPRSVYGRRTARTARPLKSTASRKRAPSRRAKTSRLPVLQPSKPLGLVFAEMEDRAERRLPTQSPQLPDVRGSKLPDPWADEPQDAQAPNATPTQDAPLDVSGTSTPPPPLEEPANTRQGVTDSPLPLPRPAQQAEGSPSDGSSDGDVPPTSIATQPPDLDAPAPQKPQPPDLDVPSRTNQQTVNTGIPSRTNRNATPRNTSEDAAANPPRVAGVSLPDPWSESQQAPQPTSPTQTQDANASQSRQSPPEPTQPQQATARPAPTERPPEAARARQEPVGEPARARQESVGESVAQEQPPRPSGTARDRVDAAGGDERSARQQTGDRGDSELTNALKELVRLMTSNNETLATMNETLRSHGEHLSEIAQKIESVGGLR